MSDAIETLDMAEFSTGHMTLNDSTILDGVASGGRRLGITVAKYDGGYFLHVSIDQDYLDRTLKSMEEAGLSEAFRKLYRECSEQMVVVIRFDCDADKQKGFEVFDW
jgi:hypothetical protein